LTFVPDLKTELIFSSSRTLFLYFFFLVLSSCLFHVVNTIFRLPFHRITSRDVKKIRTRGYLRIKLATGRKRILKIDIRYSLPAGTGIFDIRMLTGQVRVL